MAILLRCRAGFHLPTGQVTDQNRQLPSPLCRQARPCHSARLHSVVHFDARIPSGPKPAKLSGPPEVYRSTQNALQRFQQQKVERLWRSLKYESVYLHAYASVADARVGMGAWLHFYNEERLHQAHGYRTPRQIYEGQCPWTSGRSAAPNGSAPLVCRAGSTNEEMFTVAPMPTGINNNKDLEIENIAVTLRLAPPSVASIDTVQ